MQGARSRDERPPRSGSCCGPRLGNVRCAPNNGPWQHLGRKSQLSHFRTHAPQDVPSFGQPQRDPSGSTHLATHFARTLPHIRAPEPLPFSVAEERLRTDHLDALLEEVVSSSTASSAAAWVGSFRSISTRFLLGPPGLRRRLHLDGTRANAGSSARTHPGWFRAPQCQPGAAIKTNKYED